MEMMIAMMAVMRRLSEAMKHLVCLQNCYGWEIHTLLSEKSFQDCGDRNASALITNSSCPVGQFQCISGDCIPATKVCDRVYDCPDKSDESSKCCKSIN